MVPEVLLLKVGEIFAIPATPQTARLHRWQKGKGSQNRQAAEKTG